MDPRRPRQRARGPAQLHGGRRPRGAAPELASLSALDFTDRSRALAELRRATAVEEVGSQTIFDVPTRGYRGRVPAAGRVQELGDVLDRLLEQQLA